MIHKSVLNVGPAKAQRMGLLWSGRLKWGHCGYSALSDRRWIPVHDRLACQTLIDSDAILPSLRLSALVLPCSRADTDDYSGRCGSSCRGESDIIGQRRRRYPNVPEPSGARKNQRQTRYRHCIQHGVAGVTRKTVSSKSALYISHDSHQVPVSIVLTLASLMFCTLAWVTDLPEALLIT